MEMQSEKKTNMESTMKAQKKTQKQKDSKMKTQTRNQNKRKINTESKAKAGNKKKTSVKFEKEDGEVKKTKVESEVRVNTSDKKKMLVKFNVKSQEQKKSNVESTMKKDRKNTTNLKSAVNKQKRRQWKHHVCTVCGAKFMGPFHLRAHMRIHTGEKPFRCTFCGKTFAQKGACKEHERTHTREKPFKCPICDKGFSRMYGLKEHGRIHSRDELYMCKYCNKQFSRESNCVKHMNTHKGTKPFDCSLCSSRFPHSDSLKVHMMKHNCEQHYSCDTCGSAFLTRNSLRVHMYINHPKEKVYQCSKCKHGGCTTHTRYRRRCAVCYKYLKNNAKENYCEAHLKTPLSGKIYECEVCGVVFNTMSSLTKHEKIHIKKFRCTLCNKVCRSKQGLTLHTETHRPESDFECGICNKVFLTKFHLKKHCLSLHDLKKPVCCTMCSKNLKDGFHLARHLLTHIKKEIATSSKNGLCKDDNSENVLLRDKKCRELGNSVVEDGEEPAEKEGSFIYNEEIQTGTDEKERSVMLREKDISGMGCREKRGNETEDMEGENWTLVQDEDGLRTRIIKEKRIQTEILDTGANMKELVEVLVHVDGAKNTEEESQISFLDKDVIKKKGIQTEILDTGANMKELVEVLVHVDGAKNTEEESQISFLVKDVTQMRIFNEEGTMSRHWDRVNRKGFMENVVSGTRSGGKGCQTGYVDNDRNQTGYVDGDRSQTVDVDGDWNQTGFMNGDGNSAKILGEVGKQTEQGEGTDKSEFVHSVGSAAGNGEESRNGNIDEDKTVEKTGTYAGSLDKDVNRVGFVSEEVNGTRTFGEGNQDVFIEEDWNQTGNMEEDKTLNGLKDKAGRAEFRTRIVNEGNKREFVGEDSGRRRNVEKEGSLSGSFDKVACEKGLDEVHGGRNGEEDTSYLGNKEKYHTSIMEKYGNWSGFDENANVIEFVKEVENGSGNGEKGYETVSMSMMYEGGKQTRSVMKEGMWTALAGRPTNKRGLEKKNINEIEDNDFVRGQYGAALDRDQTKILARGGRCTFVEKQKKQIVDDEGNVGRAAMDRNQIRSNSLAEEEIGSFDSNGYCTAGVEKEVDLRVNIEEETQHRDPEKDHVYGDAEDGRNRTKLVAKEGSIVRFYGKPQMFLDKEINQLKKIDERNKFVASSEDGDQQTELLEKDGTKAKIRFYYKKGCRTSEGKERKHIENMEEENQLEGTTDKHQSTLLENEESGCLDKDGCSTSFVEQEVNQDVHDEGRLGQAVGEDEGQALLAENEEIEAGLANKEEYHMANKEEYHVFVEEEINRLMGDNGGAQGSAADVTNQTRIRAEGVTQNGSLNQEKQPISLADRQTDKVEEACEELNQNRSTIGRDQIKLLKELLEEKGIVCLNTDGYHTSLVKKRINHEENMHGEINQCEAVAKDRGQAKLVENREFHTRFLIKDGRVLCLLEKQEDVNYKDDIDEGYIRSRATEEDRYQSTVMDKEATPMELLAKNEYSVVLDEELNGVETMDEEMNQVDDMYKDLNHVGALDNERKQGGDEMDQEQTLILEDEDRTGYVDEDRNYIPLEEGKENQVVFVDEDEEHGNLKRIVDEESTEFVDKSGNHMPFVETVGNKIGTVQKGRNRDEHLMEDQNRVINVHKERTEVEHRQKGRHHVRFTDDEVNQTRYEEKLRSDVEPEPMDEDENETESVGTGTIGTFQPPRDTTNIDSSSLPSENYADTPGFAKFHFAYQEERIEDPTDVNTLDESPVRDPDTSMTNICTVLVPCNVYADDVGGTSRRHIDTNESLDSKRFMVENGQTSDCLDIMDEGNPAGEAGLEIDKSLGSKPLIVDHVPYGHRQEISDDEDNLTDDAYEDNLKPLIVDNRTTHDFQNSTEDNMTDDLFCPQDCYFSCFVCSKTFSQLGDVKCHMKIHAREKCYRCRFCDKLFLRENDLNKHKVEHLKRKCKCSVCGKIFAFAGDLRHHLRIHTPKLSPGDTIPYSSKSSPRSAAHTPKSSPNITVLHTLKSSPIF